MWSDFVGTPSRDWCRERGRGGGGRGPAPGGKRETRRPRRVGGDGWVHNRFSFLVLQKNVQDVGFNTGGNDTVLLGCNNPNPISLYRFELGMSTYPYRAFGCHPGVWSKINFSQKVRYRIKAQVIIFLLRYWSGVDFTSLPRTNGAKLSKLESLLNFG